MNGLIHVEHNQTTHIFRRIEMTDCLRLRRGRNKRKNPNILTKVKGNLIQKELEK